MAAEELEGAEGGGGAAEAGVASDERGEGGEGGGVGKGPGGGARRQQRGRGTSGGDGGGFARPSGQRRERGVRTVGSDGRSCWNTAGHGSMPAAGRLAGSSPRSMERTVDAAAAAESLGRVEAASRPGLASISTGAGGCVWRIVVLQGTTSQTHNPTRRE